MRLTLHTDYSLRVLLYLATHPDRLVSTQEISEAYGISKNHLVKVVLTLGKHGFLDVRPGRTGGLALGRPPAEISLGLVVQTTEPDFFLVECFDSKRNQCPITPVCGLPAVLTEAHNAFLKVLLSYSLEDVLRLSNQSFEPFFLNQPASASPQPRQDKNT
ncbi:MAG: Rrf2 family transcriptional regulator [Blastocatellia bacterium]|nr:Rrf2 family transcriptional regulator [Blastocatellia bacterium]